MAFSRYKRFLRLCEKWPKDEEKSGDPGFPLNAETPRFQVETSRP